jgi:hypothetical protein
MGAQAVLNERDDYARVSLAIDIYELPSFEGILNNLIALTGIEAGPVQRELATTVNSLTDPPRISVNGKKTRSSSDSSAGSWGALLQIVTPQSGCATAVSENVGIYKSPNTDCANT